MTLRITSTSGSPIEMVSIQKENGENHKITDHILKCLLEVPLMKDWCLATRLVKLNDYASVISFREATGTLTWPCPKIRDYFHKPVTDIVERLASERFSKTDQILELGSGVPAYGCQSYLSSLVPKAFRGQVESSDINPTIARDARKLGFRNVVHIDATKLSSTKAIESIDKIIAANFLDTLSKENLKATLAEIVKVLKPDGEFIHISDVDPFVEGFISQHVTEDNIPFILTKPNGQTEGLQILDKAVYIKTVRPLLEKKISRLELEFLDWYASLSKLEKEYILTRISKDVFSKWFKSIIPSECLTVVGRYAWYENTLKAAMSNAGLKIVKVEKSEASEFLEKKEIPLPSGYNHFINDQGHLDFARMNSLHPNLVRVESRVYVLVAKKLIHQ